MHDFNQEERVQQAVNNFMSGYNCAQSLFLAYADLFDIDPETAKCMSVSFGGGVGRMREICGAVSAMAMLTGFKYRVEDPSDQAARSQNYAMVQTLAQEFRSRFHSIVCRELLPEAEAAKHNPTPSLRTAAYYAQRPCARYVEGAAEIVGRMLKEEL